MSVQLMSLSETQSVPALRGKTILVTRPREQAVQLAQMLEQSGATVVLFPTIHIVQAESWDECDRALQSLHSYHGVIFASMNAATFFLSRVRLIDASLFDILAKIPIYVVGEKTNRAVEAFQLTPTKLERVSDAQTLAQAITKTDIKGKRFLLPRGNLARADLRLILRQHKAVVDEVVVYETRPPQETEITGVKKMLADKRIHIVTFFSPSSIKNFLGLIPRTLLEGIHVAVIGKTTAQAAKSSTLPVHIIALQPTAENLVSAIAKFYG